MSKSITINGRELTVDEKQMVYMALSHMSDGGSEADEYVAEILNHWDDWEGSENTPGHKPDLTEEEFYEEITRLTDEAYNALGNE